MSTRVQCPTCNANVDWNEDFPYRPFCSLRCRNEDLCAWADEKHALPGGPEGDEVYSSALETEPD